MGDWFETVVDQRATPAEAVGLAERVIAELVRRRFGRPERTACTLGAEGHPPATDVLGYLRMKDNLLLSLRTNGLEVSTERSVHISSDLERIACPACMKPCVDLDAMQWQDAVAAWYDGGTGLLACPHCGRGAPVADWPHEPACGFGYLAFTFWNWPPFTPEAWLETPAAVIEAVVGRSCVIVYGKL